ncbi:hypothetical protein pb186bvf_001795 [Paramecium bursaria]
MRETNQLLDSMERKVSSVIRTKSKNSNSDDYEKLLFSHRPNLEQTISREERKAQLNQLNQLVNKFEVGDMDQSKYTILDRNYQKKFEILNKRLENLEGSQKRDRVQSTISVIQTDGDPIMQHSLANMNKTIRFYQNQVKNLQEQMVRMQRHYSSQIAELQHQLKKATHESPKR